MEGFRSFEALMPNQRPTLDAGSPLGLHSGRHWLGASEAECWMIYAE